MELISARWYVRRREWVEVILPNTKTHNDNIKIMDKNNHKNRWQIHEVNNIKDK